MPGLASSLHGRLTGTASRAKPSKAAIAFESPKPLVCAIRLLPEMYEGQVCALLESKSCGRGEYENRRLQARGIQEQKTTDEGNVRTVFKIASEGNMRD